MPIRFHCEFCDARVRVPDGSEGRAVRCPRCRAALVVPTESVAPTEAPAPETPPVNEPEPETADSSAAEPVSAVDADDALAALAGDVSQDVPVDEPLPPPPPASEELPYGASMALAALATEPLPDAGSPDEMQPPDVDDLSVDAANALHESSPPAREVKAKVMQKPPPPRAIASSRSSTPAAPVKSPTVVRASAAPSPVTPARPNPAPAQPAKRRSESPPIRQAIVRQPASPAQPFTAAEAQASSTATGSPLLRDLDDDADASPRGRTNTARGRKGRKAKAPNYTLLTFVANVLRLAAICVIPTVAMLAPKILGMALLTTFEKALTIMLGVVVGLVIWGFAEALEALRDMARNSFR